MSENFVYDVPKTLPVILMLDTSGSMCGNKIATLNEAVNTMLKSFREEDSVIASISVAIVEFNSNVRLVNKLDLVNEVNDINLSAGGTTSLGAALTLVKSIVEDKEKFPKRSYRPTIICVSDGMPNDNWEGPLDDFKNNGRTAKCHCMAMSIGAEKGTREFDVLKRFAGDEENVFFANDAMDIKKFFKLITTTIKTRTQSANPNLIPQINASDLEEACDDENDLF